MGIQARVSRSKLEERAKLRGLLERFGSLLTERQTAMVRGYAVEGLSFSEIARQQNVSRQAVHEAVRAAERVLTDYQSKLSHLSNHAAPVHPFPAADLNQVFNKLETLKLKIARTGIIYSVDWIRREIDSVMDLLADQQKEHDGTSVGATISSALQDEHELVAATQSA